MWVIELREARTAILRQRREHNNYPDARADYEWYREAYQGREWSVTLSIWRENA